MDSTREPVAATVSTAKSGLAEINEEKSAISEKSVSALDQVPVRTGDSNQSSSTSFLHHVAAWSLTLYTCYALFGMVAWVSHLGARLTWLQPILVAKGYASNKPVADVYELFYYNGVNALLFILPHSFLRPPRLVKYVGFRYARAVYCAMAGLTCHILMAFFRPINMNKIYEIGNAVYVYDEEQNIPLFQLPVPRWVHDYLSVGMLLFAIYSMMSDYRTYIILGHNRAAYGVNSGKDKFPSELSPRMDIITWMGYTVWLKAGSLGFVLFSGLSILPYKVFSWDIITRVVAASYLRARSQGFRIFVGKIEHTHHFIWVLRGVIVVAALGYQYSLLQKRSKTSGDNEEDVLETQSLFTVQSIAIMAVSAVGVGVLLHRLERIK